MARAVGPGRDRDMGGSSSWSRYAGRCSGGWRHSAGRPGHAVDLDVDEDVDVDGDDLDEDDLLDGGEPLAYPETERAVGGTEPGAGDDEPPAYPPTEPAAEGDAEPRPGRGPRSERGARPGRPGRPGRPSRPGRSGGGAGGSDDAALRAIRLRLPARAIEVYADPSVAGGHVNSGAAVLRRVGDAPVVEAPVGQVTAPGARFALVG